MPYKQADGAVAQSRVSLERAELNLQAAAALDPNNAEIQLELARALASLGKGAEARVALERLRSLAEKKDANALRLLPDAEAAIKAAGL
jgi:Flp pilus assembly protein TadD